MIFFARTVIFLLPGNRVNTSKIISFFSPITQWQNRILHIFLSHATFGHGTVFCVVFSAFVIACWRQNQLKFHVTTHINATESEKSLTNVANVTYATYCPYLPNIHETTVDQAVWLIVWLFKRWLCIPTEYQMILFEPSFKMKRYLIGTSH